MPAAHRLAELAPRDVVARAIFAECLRSGAPHVWLDARRLHSGAAQERFPTIYSRCLERGLDMSRDLIPVAPVAHYCVGGVRTDTFGRTSVPGLFACGETASTGVHGANRLASNSLLESLVFAGRAASRASDWDGREWKPDLLPPEGEWRPVHELPACLCRKDDATAPPAPGFRAPTPALLAEILSKTREVMWRDFGIVRRAEGMAPGLSELDRLGRLFCASWAGPFWTGEDAGPGRRPSAVPHMAVGEARNLVSAGTLIAISATLRTESRGAHSRVDHPKTTRDWQKHTLVRLSGRTVSHALAPLENVEVES
jgi:L-aspartate oxidase